MDEHEETTNQYFSEAELWTICGSRQDDLRRYAFQSAAEQLEPYRGRAQFSVVSTVHDGGIVQRITIRARDERSTTQMQVQRQDAWFSGRPLPEPPVIADPVEVFLDGETLVELLHPEPREW